MVFSKVTVLCLRNYCPCIIILSFGCITWYTGGLLLGNVHNKSYAERNFKIRWRLQDGG